VLGTFAVVAAIISLAMPATAGAQLPNWPPQAFPLASPAGDDCVEPPAEPFEGCPNTIVAGPDGAMWMLEFWGSSVARVDANGVATASYPTPTPVAGPEKIILGPEGDLWFSEYIADKIGRVVFENGAFKEIVEYPVVTPDGGPVGLAAGPDGKIWFVTQDTSMVGRLDPAVPAGDIEEFKIPGADPFPFGIAAGPDGAMWFTQQKDNEIGRIPVDADSAAEIEEFPIRDIEPGFPLHAADIVQGPEGYLWFVEAVGEHLGRVNPANGEVTEFVMPACEPLGVHCGSFWLASGPDENIWFTAFDSGLPEGNWLGRATPAGQVEMEQLGVPNSQPYGIAPGLGCDIWFTEFLVNALARLQTGCAAPAFAVAPASFDFGSRQLGSGAGAAQAFTVTNQGDAGMTIGTVALSGSGAGSFALTPGNNCSGQTLAPAATCTVSVAFAPTSAGAKAASLDFPGEDPGAVALTGTGTEATVDPPSPSPPPPPPPPTAEATALKVTPQRLLPGAATKIRFKLTSASRVEITVRRWRQGKLRHVTRFRRAAISGHNAIAYRAHKLRDGRREPLAAGSYRVSLRVVSGGDLSAPLHARFTVVRR
jgi:virginiamycin B lyase